MTMVNLIQYQTTMLSNDDDDCDQVDGSDGDDDGDSDGEDDNHDDLD